MENLSSLKKYIRFFADEALFSFAGDGFYTANGSFCIESDSFYIEIGSFLVDFDTFHIKSGSFYIKIGSFYIDDGSFCIGIDCFFIYSDSICIAFLIELRFQSLKTMLSFMLSGLTLSLRFRLAPSSFNNSRGWLGGSSERSNVP